jgi:hypothetical protein
MVGRLAAVLLGVAALGLVTSGTASAQSGKCGSSKIKAACKKASCKAGLEAKEAQSGTAPSAEKIAKCEGSFAKTFSKAEGKGGCVTTGDGAAIETKIDAFVADLDTELNVGTGTNPNKCEADKIKAAAKKASCKCALEAKQAQKGGTLDPAKVAKCEAGFSKSFAKAEGKGGCNTTGDAATIEAKVDAFLSDLSGELDPTTTTLPPTTSTTTTTVATTSTTTNPPTEVMGALTSTPGRFNYNLTLGLPGANAACNSNFPGTHACTYAELQIGEGAGDLVGLKDTAMNTVTSFWAIDNGQPGLQQCIDDAAGGSNLNWEYGTAHTPSRGQRVTLTNGTGTLGSLQSSIQCNIAGNSWVGCCL